MGPLSQKPVLPDPIVRALKTDLLPALTPQIRLAQRDRSIPPLGRGLPAPRHIAAAPFEMLQLAAFQIFSAGIHLAQ